MNYQGIVNWLQEDDFVILGFTTLGESALMEKETGVEVSDLPAFLIASVLPTAKRKVVYEMRKRGHEMIIFTEFNYTDRVEVAINSAIDVTEVVGKGHTAEYATVNAIENFIKKTKGEK